MLAAEKRNPCSTAGCMSNQLMKESILLQKITQLIRSFGFIQFINKTKFTCKEMAKKRGALVGGLVD